MDERGPVSVGVDVGGTFTDVVLLDGADVTTAKVPTTADQSVGVLEGIDRACQQADLDPSVISRFRHAMTVSVNALLEGDGAETALVTTSGFRDVLAIGRQDRPALYDLDARTPEPLVPRERRIEVEERATPNAIETPVTEADVEDVLAALPESVESVAVSFLHAYGHPDNERAVATALREQLDVPVSASHDVLGAFREYERTATTVADAYVRPVIDAYLSRLEERAAERGLPAPRIMQSNGGIADAETARTHAVTTVMSGPAAGVVGAAAGEVANVITFDMGGTSSDVSLVRDGEIERTTEADVGGHPVRVPMVDVNTVGAGGGSIAWVDDGGALRVGPQSAGADPGPACYDAGGENPTVTDASLVLGYLGADTTLGDDLSLAPGAAERVLADLASEADLAGPLEAARGVYRVANATMTRAIRDVTVERGHDPREFALVAFGGAGPMHAAALAQRLGVEDVIVPRAGGVRSAFGLLAADESHDAVRTYRAPLPEADVDDLEARYADLAERVLADASDPDRASVEREADLRYAGQSHELTVAVPDPFDPATVERRFHEAHERARGYRMAEPVDLVGLRTTATIPETTPTITHEGDGAARVGRREAFFDGEFRETPVYRRDRIAQDTVLDGPVIFEGGESTVVVPPGWTVRVRETGALLLERDATEGER